MTLVKNRHSNVSAKIPTVAQLQEGELAVNTYDGVIYTKKKVGTTETIVKFPNMENFEGLRIYLESIFQSAIVLRQGVSDSSGLVTCDCQERQFPQFFISVGALSTLQINNLTWDYGTYGLLFIKATAVANKLRVPTDYPGCLLLSDDVWAWDNFNNTSKSVVEYTTGPPTYATFSCTHHGYTTGSYVKITGYSGNKASYNGVHLLTSVDLNTFRIDVAYQASGTASSPSVTLQEKVFNIPDSLYTHIYEFVNNDTGDLYIYFKNKVKRY